MQRDRFRFESGAGGGAERRQTFEAVEKFHIRCRIRIKKKKVATKGSDFPTKDVSFRVDSVNVLLLLCFRLYVYV